jgi:hypothetical protein
MSESTRQHYRLATGKGLEPAPGGKTTQWKKGGSVRRPIPRKSSGRKR